jgi:hypothetical protein
MYHGKYTLIRMWMARFRLRILGSSESFSINGDEGKMEFI